MTVCSITADSSTASASATVSTVTACAVAQFRAVNVRLGGENVTSVLPLRDGVTVTSPVGAEVSTTS